MILTITYNGVDTEIIYSDAIPNLDAVIDLNPSVEIKINL